MKKETFIDMYKRYIKNTRLTTEHLKIDVPCKPIYISEFYISLRRLVMCNNLNNLTFDIKQIVQKPIIRL